MTSSLCWKKKVQFYRHTSCMMSGSRHQAVPIYSPHDHKNVTSCEPLLRPKSSPVGRSLWKGWHFSHITFMVIMFFFNNFSLKVTGPLEVQEIHRSILEQQSYTEEDKKLIFTFRWWCAYVSDIRNNQVNFYGFSFLVSAFYFRILFFFHSLSCNPLFRNMSFWRYAQIMWFLIQKRMW